MADIIIQSAVVSHTGLVRGNNEDNFCLDGICMQRGKADDGAFITGNCEDEYQLYAVCDGMGGTEGGEEAAFCAVSALAERKKDYEKLADEVCLTEMLRDISERILDDAIARDQRSGTTIAMVLVAGSSVLVSNVGDSRIYRFRRGILTQISEDHSKVQRMVAMGLISPEQARVDPNRHIISQYLGMSEGVSISPFIDSSGRLQEDDIFLLCSDGLTDMAGDREIEAILLEEKEPADMARKLVDAALRSGGRDNVTAMILKVTQVSLEPEEKAALSGGSRFRFIMSAAQILAGCGLAAMIAYMVYQRIH